MNALPALAITQGDPAGIGPEIVAKAFRDAPQVLRSHVSSKIGAIARPRQVYVVAELPKTRSGKIMRRLLRDVADGKAVGDTTTLTDASVMSAISAGVTSGTADDD